MRRHEFSKSHLQTASRNQRHCCLVVEIEFEVIRFGGINKGEYLKETFSIGISGFFLEMRFELDIASGSTKMFQPFQTTILFTLWSTPLLLILSQTTANFRTSFDQLSTQASPSAVWAEIVAPRRLNFSSASDMVPNFIHISISPRLMEHKNCQENTVWYHSMNMEG